VLLEDTTHFHQHLNYCGFNFVRLKSLQRVLNFNLVGAFTQNYRGGRLEKNSQVQPD